MAKWIALLVLGVLAAGLVAGCGDGEDGARAEGSGSTFARQAFVSWCAESDLCTYRAVGSGKGAEEVVDQTTEFGASDVPLTADEVATFGRTSGDVAPQGSSPVQVPVLLGAVTVATNVSGVDYSSQRLRFSGPTLARIFAGDITTWSNPRIAADNPGVRLPAAPITRCVREDSSGTTAVFTEFLSRVDPGFEETVGASRLPDWPGARVERSPGNEGVGACLQDRADTIGYIDLADGVTLFGEGAPPERVYRLAQVGVERAGATQWVSPTVRSTALAGSVGLPAGAPLTDYGSRILDAPVEGAYPIVATTYMIVHDRYASAQTCDAVSATARWALSDRGQAAIEAAFYAPVAASIRSRGRNALAAVRDGDGAPCGTR
ncbi:MAG: phosphate ABC transporter substrate-binding protein PstS [Thermoleophilia bacterium]